MEQIIIDISPAGSVQIDAQGFKGNSCAKATEQIELVLGAGAQKKSDTKKPEFYAPNTTGQTNKLTF
jgi:hypothetical protein